MTETKRTWKLTPAQLKRRVAAHDRYQQTMRKQVPNHVTLREAAVMVHRTPQALSDRIRKGTLAAVKVRNAQTAEYWISLDEIDRVFPRSTRTEYRPLTTEQQRAVLGPEVFITSDPKEMAQAVEQLQADQKETS